MITTEHKYSLSKNKLVIVATPHVHGVDVKAYNEGDKSGEFATGPHSRPIASAIAWTVRHNVKLTFVEELVNRPGFRPTREGVRAITYFAATLGNATDGESTFVSPGNLTVMDTSSADLHLHDIGFPQGLDRTRLAGDVQGELSADYPAEFHGATVVPHPVERELQDMVAQAKLLPITVAA